MTISSGFFNSVNHDRLYDAEQIGSIFDGIINDGVYESFGDAFSVTPNSSVNDSVIVGTGRAWFDHTWTYNDAQFSLTLEPPNLVASRIDAIVIDVDRRDSVRNNSIIVVQGTPAQDPQKPTMISEELHSQYPIAYVTVPPGDSEPISSSNIEYNVGQSSCPLVTGPLEVINSDNFFAQMDSNFEDFKNELDAEWTTWFDGIKDLIDDLQIGNINLVNSVDNVTIEWPSESKKLQVKDRGITRGKLSFDLQSIIGVLDPSDWSYQDYYDHVSSLDSSSEEETFINQYLSSSVVSVWTAQQIENFYSILKSNTSKNKLWDGINWISYNVSDFKSLVETFGSSKYSSTIGKKIHLDMGNTYGAHDFVLIGINHDDLVSGGKAFMTFQSEDIVLVKDFGNTMTVTDRYSTSEIAELVESMYDSFDQTTKQLIKEVTKIELATRSLTLTNFDTKVWIASGDETNTVTKVGGKQVGKCYDYWSKSGSQGSTLANPYFVKNYHGSPNHWMTRTMESYATYTSANQIVAKYYGVNETGAVAEAMSTGSWDHYSNSFINNRTSSYPGYNIAEIVPCFCV